MTVTGNMIVTDKYDLFKNKYLANFWRSKYYPLVFQVAFAAIMVGMIYHGLSGPLSTNENAISMGAFFVFWWGIIFVMGVMGRSWCAICPVGAVSGAVNRFNRGYNFPQKLSNWALPAASYALLIWGLDLVFSWSSTPFSFAIWFIGIVGLALMMGFAFKGRTFCKYMCPITAPLAVMARISPIEVRARTQGSTYSETYIKNITMIRKSVASTSSSSSDAIADAGETKNGKKLGNKNKNVRMIDPECKECKTHDCAKGNEETEGCPWDQHPSVMMENNSCSMCMKCTHSCPSGQPMRLRLRNPLSELSKVFRPNAGEIAIIMILLSYYSIYDWPLIVDLGFPGFSESFLSSLHTAFPFITEDNVRYLLVGFFMTMGIVFGMYSLASYASAKISKTKFKLNFNNYGYAYLLIFILPLPLSVTIGYVPYYGEFLNIPLNTLGINMNLSSGFLLQDFLIYQNAEYDIKFRDILYSLPVFFAIPIGIYLVNRISRNMLDKHATSVTVLKTGLPHMILITMFTLAAFYSDAYSILNN
jgi:polyferredoxin